MVRDVHVEEKMGNLITLIGESEAAEILGLAIQTMRKWLLERTGPPYHKLGRSVRYSPDDLKIYINSKRITPEPAGKLNK